jgi:undecaprenyl-diphosphatase
MNYIDSHIISFLNGFSRASWGFDQLMVFIADANFLKGGVLVTIIWWLWFRNERQNLLIREHIISTLVSSFIALFFSRTLTYTTPFRLRPFHDPDLNFQLPYGVEITLMESWSSFPSDHAVLFFALATGIWFISRSTGALAITYILIVICFPRIYLGYHYPTDMLGGALAGIGIGWLLNTNKLRTYIAHPVMRWLRRAPGPVYACFFLFTYQIAVLFHDVRAIGSLIKKVFRLLLA